MSDVVNTWRLWDLLESRYSLKEKQKELESSLREMYELRKEGGVKGLRLVGLERVTEDGNILKFYYDSYLGGSKERANFEGVGNFSVSNEKRCDVYNFELQLGKVKVELRVYDSLMSRVLAGVEKLVRLI